MTTRSKYLSLPAFAWSIFFILLSASCKKFVTLDDPKGQLTQDAVFSEPGSAIGAVSALYTDFIAYTIPVMTKISGLAADELETVDPSLASYMNNEIKPSVSTPGYPWAQAYSNIRNCNLAIDGISRSQTLKSELKDQLLGEARLLRALSFFNLVNFFGDVPLTLSTDVIENAFLPRTGADTIWTQIFNDLDTAKALLAQDYPSDERARANKSAASALLARAYLYRGLWDKAEAEATEVIDNNIYTLADPAAAFTPNSSETILQIYIELGLNPMVYDFLPPVPGAPPAVYLRNGFEAAFEAGDLRKTSWTGSDGGVYYVQKYKNADFSATEYMVLFRLAELYLIRAEARAHLNNLSGASSAESDLNIVRARAGLPAKFGMGQLAMLQAIEQERKVELFSEYSHRWFDLKRTAGFNDPSVTRADEVLAPLKGSSWAPTDKLFPVPSDELRLNPRLVQNPGYQD